MRVCFITNEFFGLGRYGGFGKLTKMLGQRLVEKGIEVYVVSWQTPGQKEKECVDGITVLSFPYQPFHSISFLPSHFRAYLRSMYLYRIADADIYHSIENQTSSFVAQKAMPYRKHVLWFQDPYDKIAYREMALVDKEFTWNTSMKLRFDATIPLLRSACNRADKLLTQARCFIPTINRLYKPKKEISFLPNPIEIPTTKIEKSSEPTVCFLGRWDPQKRVEQFFQLAKRFPKIKFIAMGKSNYPMVDVQMRNKYGNIPNLEMTGFVSAAEKEEVLSKSWMLVNTSIREGLPISFLEASINKTAILSYVDPDNFASQFGYHVKTDNFLALGEGLNQLLADDLWKEKGEQGYSYVKENHEVNKVVKKCIDFYKELL